MKNPMPPVYDRAQFIALQPRQAIDCDIIFGRQNNYNAPDEIPPRKKLRKNCKSLLTFAQRMLYLPHIPQTDMNCAFRMFTQDSRK